MQAVEAFDMGRGLKFGTYALPRIRGAMRDGLRKRDYLTMSMRRKGNGPLLLRIDGDFETDRDMIGGMDSNKWIKKQ